MNVQKEVIPLRGMLMIETWLVVNDMLRKFCKKIRSN